MFNNNKIENQQREIDELKNELLSIKDSLKLLLDTLDGDNFSKDWEEFQKYKVLKEKLPDIEEMYQLKKLKNLIIEKDGYKKLINTVQLTLLKSESGGFYNVSETNAQKRYLDSKTREYESIVNKIDETLLYIKNKSQQKDLIEVFKLYAISTDWLKP